MLAARTYLVALCFSLVWTSKVCAQASGSEVTPTEVAEESISSEREKSESVAEDPANNASEPEPSEPEPSEPEPSEPEPSEPEPSEPTEHEPSEPTEHEPSEPELDPEAQPESAPAPAPAPAPASESQLPPPARKSQPEREEDSKDRPIELVKPFARQGEFIALGAHFDMAMADDKDRGWRKPSFGPAFSLRVGEAIVSWADIGLEFGLALPGGEEKLTSGRIIAHTRLYPHERLFLHTGFGFGFAGGPDPEHPVFQRGRYGDVYVLGVGTNLYLRDRNRSGGPMFSPSATVELGPDKDFTTMVFWIGGEFSWWAGLPRDKLDLPLDKAYQRGVHRN